ncbi:hypothetical protein NXV87_06130 [Bacteroides fragilis]|nr:hypothetical protein [Bacteroides fragilis]
MEIFAGSIYGIIISNVITDAKIRFSYGVNGTQPKVLITDIWDYMYSLDKIIMDNGGSWEARFYGNPNLKWEKNYATNNVDLHYYG